MKKYLAVLKSKKDVFEVSRIDFDNNIAWIHYNGGLISVENPTLLECINRKDIDGNELHDNAIVRVEYSNGVRVMGYIKYSQEELRYLLVTKNSTNDLSFRNKYKKIGVLGIDKF